MWDTLQVVLIYSFVLGSIYLLISLGIFHHLRSAEDLPSGICLPVHPFRLSHLDVYAGIGLGM